VREKLNDNPVAQIALVALLVAVVGFMLLKPGGSEEGEESAPTEATVSVAGTSATGTATAATPGAAVEGAIAAATVSAAGSVGGAIPPAPPIPAPVAAAYDADKTVALLVVHDSDVNDRLVAGAAERLSARSDVALFVVPVKRIADYAAITLGVDLQRAPALVVMRPRRLSAGVPQATVDYGFQTAQSVVQAVVDASYKGPEATYHPD